jgi:hypothetical protein
MSPLSKPKAVLYLTGIFLAGVVTGVVLTFVVGRHLMPDQEKMARHWTRELQVKLNLTPEQVLKVEPIIRETIAGFKTTVANDALSSLSNCNTRIAAELTPEQMPKFEQMKQEQQDFVRRKFGGEEAPQ